MEEARRCLVFDPRVGLALLVFANLAAFSVSNLFGWK